MNTDKAVRTPPPQTHGFRSFLIGETNLLAQCGELLLERGHTISGVIASNTSVQKWAAAKAIACIPTLARAEEMMREHDFDYLFSIGNLRMIHEDILTLPGKQAINFHDGPLPRYAGVNATAWAIMNGEKSHGVTWHVMTAHPDEGLLLKQRAVAVNSDETTFSLNMKCFEAGIISFKELIEDLTEGRIRTLRQDPSDRSYFAKHQRPRAACTLSWDRPAEEIERFVRALNFGELMSGRYVNPLGKAKLACERGFLLVPQAAASDTASKDPAGTVVAMHEDTILVATRNRDILLKDLLTLDGALLSEDDLRSRFDLHVGSRLLDISPSTARAITTCHVDTCRHEAFWADRIAHLQPLPLPFRSPAAGQSQPSHKERVECSIPHKLDALLKRMHPGPLREEFLQAAFCAFMSRICAVTEYDIGFSNDELRHRHTETKGLFAASVPIRVTVAQGESVMALGQALRKQFAVTCRCLTYPLDLPVRYPACHKDDGTFSTQLPIQLLASAGEEEAEENAVGALTLVTPRAGAAYLCIFDPAKIGKQDVTSLMQHFAAFVEASVDHPDRSVAALPLLDSATRDDLVVQRNDTAVAWPERLCIHQDVERRAEAYADLPAVACAAEETLSYAMLNGKANQLAHHLRACGVGPDTLVGISMSRCTDMLVGLLGILKAGGAYVPLDPAYPGERIAFMIRDSGMPVLLTQEALRASLPAHDATVVLIDHDWSEIQKEPVHALHTAVQSHHLAYLIYTSGSTGQPKGVQVEHRNVINFFTAMDAAVRHQPGDVMLAVTSLSFDISVLETLWALARGFTVVIDPQTGAGHQGTVPALMRAHRVTHFQCTPSLAAMLMLEPEARTALATLRVLMVGGEGLPVALAADLRTVVRGDLINMYGPTETTIWSMTCRIDEAMNPISIGRPIANTQIYIADYHMQLLPPGIQGEVLIGGAGVARGYHNRPELTADRFIPNPFTDPTAGRVYRTGDVGRYLPDGTIECLGRLDHQVKIRGHRIDLGEIEVELTKQAAIREAIVIAREDDAHQKRLVAYVIPTNGYDSDSLHICEQLTNRLPDYMIPSQVVSLEAFPLTPNRKIDRKALPQPAEMRPVKTTGRDAPHSAVESALAQVWMDMLKVADIGRKDDFFNLGGDSLAACHLAAGIQEACGVHFPFERLFRSTALCDMAAQLETIFIENGMPDDRESPPQAQTATEPHAQPTNGFEAPCTPEEQAIARIWTAMLGEERIDRRDSFFDLGGSSLQAMSLFMEIEDQFGKQLPLATLFQADTLAKLAQLVKGNDTAAASWSPLVSIQEKGATPPFFCVHAAGGNVLLYRPLAMQMKQDRPFYGLQCPGLDGQEDCLSSIEDMARHYLQEIRSVQPEGPYHLGGFCMGGLVAYEMAQQLHRDGQETALVAMVDTVNPARIPGPRSMTEKLVYNVQKIGFHWRNAAQLTPHQRVEYLTAKTRWAGIREFSRLSTCLPGVSTLRGLLNKQVQPEVFLEDFNEEISAQYRPRPYDGKVALLRPRKHYSFCSDHEMGWGALTNGNFQTIDLAVYPGGLFTQPYVQLLAEALDRCLESRTA